MDEINSKREFLRQEIRLAMRMGHYLPGEWINQKALQTRYKAGVTPVREALLQLDGMNLLIHNGRAGFHVPLPTEVALRERYGWMHRLLLMACDIGFAPSSQEAPGTDLETVQDNLATTTWTLFDAIAQAIGDAPLAHAIELANEQLAPVRHAKQELIDNGIGEVAELRSLWQERDTRKLKSALVSYHDRRKRFVPTIVAMLTQGRGHLPN